FDLDLIGGWFEGVAYLLPFAHAVDASRAAISGDYTSILPHLWWVIGYAVAIMVIAIIVFRKKMSGDK
ncbi:MAG: ABC transporter permease, partial [Staphylococcus equorum]